MSGNTRNIDCSSFHKASSPAIQQVDIANNSINILGAFLSLASFCETTQNGCQLVAQHVVHVQGESVLDGIKLKAKHVIPFFFFRLALAMSRSGNLAFELACPSQRHDAPISLVAPRGISLMASSPISGGGGLRRLSSP